MKPEAVWMNDLYRPVNGYPVGVRAGPFLFLSGQVARHPTEGLIRGVQDLPTDGRGLAGGHAYVDAIEGPVAAQTWHIYRSLQRVLQAQGSALDQVLRFHIYQRDKRFFPAFERVRMQYEPAHPAPSSGLGVSGVQGGAQAWIDMDGIALVPGAGLPAREVLSAPGVLPSASAYSQGVRTGPYVFLAGHIPIDTAAPGKPVILGYDDVPAEGRFLRTGRSHPDARDGPIAAQTWYTYSEIQRLLATQGASLRDVLNLTVFLQDMRDLPTFHRVHERLFSDEPPALTVTEFAEVGHRGTRIEIEATALIPGQGVMRRTLSSSVRPGLHAPPAIEAGPLVFLSGAIGWGPAGPVRGPTDLPPEGREAVERLYPHRPAVAAQAWAGVDALRQTLTANGLGLSNLAKLTVYLQDLDEFEAFEAMRRALMPGSLPAVSPVQIPGPGPTKEIRLCVEAIACR